MSNNDQSDMQTALQVEKLILITRYVFAQLEYKATINNIKQLEKPDIYLDIFMIMFPYKQDDLILIKQKYQENKRKKGNITETMKRILSLFLKNFQNAQHITVEEILNGNLKKILNLWEIIQLHAEQYPENSEVYQDTKKQNNMYSDYSKQILDDIKSLKNEKLVKMKLQNQYLDKENEILEDKLIHNQNHIKFQERFMIQHYYNPKQIKQNYKNLKHKSKIIDNKIQQFERDIKNQKSSLLFTLTTFKDNQHRKDLHVGKGDIRNHNFDEQNVMEKKDIRNTLHLYQYIQSNFNTEIQNMAGNLTKLRKQKQFQHQRILRQTSVERYQQEQNQKLLDLKKEQKIFNRANSAKYGKMLQQDNKKIKIFGGISRHA